MSRIQIIDRQFNSEELRDLSDQELNVQGGIINFAVLAFGAGYAVGTGIYNMYCRIVYY